MYVILKDSLSYDYTLWASHQQKICHPSTLNAIIGLESFTSEFYTFFESSRYNMYKEMKVAHKTHEINSNGILVYKVSSNNNYAHINHKYSEVNNFHESIDYQFNFDDEFDWA